MDKGDAAAGSGLWTLGVDFGTGSWKMALLEDRRPRELISLATMDEAVDYVKNVWAQRHGLPMVVPSGFGVPLLRLSAAGTDDLFVMSLRKGDPASGGLGLFLARLRDAGVDGYCLPAVKGLASVPPWRTLNKVDMGTSDKLCAAAYLIDLLQQRDARPYAELSFLSLEVGFAFKCWLVVRDGRIVDGIGGTAGTMGPHARGAIDGELAYLHGFERKGDIYAGGWLDLGAHFGQEKADAAFWEGLEMERLALSAYHGIDMVVVSGRRRAAVGAQWGERLGDRLQVLHEDDAGFEPALGGALLANGLAGGQLGPLVEHLGLRQARRSALDDIAWGSASSPDATGHAKRLKDEQRAARG